MIMGSFSKILLLERSPDGSRGDFMRVPMFIYEWTIKDLAQEARKHDAEIILMLLRKFKY